MTRDFETTRVALPTLGMNPMAKQHVATFLDGLPALDADSVGAAAVREAEPDLRTGGRGRGDVWAHPAGAE
ncbi:hypothetical protein J0H58_01495 [bacterium]|nr:hypothetical protein [bacterium]